MKETGTLPVPPEAELRQLAIRRLKKKGEFRSHLYVYLVVNLGLWAVWFIDGLNGSFGFPWPVFPTLFWGLFVVGHASDVYGRDPLREDRVQREMEELRSLARVRPLDTLELDDDDWC